MFQQCFLDYYALRCQTMQDHFFMATNYFDPDGIHDLRVEIKQLRAFFRLIEWITPIFTAKKNIRKIRKLFKSAATLRDIHVQQTLTQTWSKELGVFLSEYYNGLKQKELPAQRQFATFASHFDLQREVIANKERILGALENLSDEYASAQIQARIDQLLRQIIEYGNESGYREESLHKIRILTKETRYTAEIAQRCFPELGYNDEFIQGLRGLHQILGKWHDTEIALEHLDEFQTEFYEQVEGTADHTPLTDMQIYETLCQKLQEEKTTSLTAFEKNWHDFLLLRNRSK